MASGRTSEAPKTLVLKGLRETEVKIRARVLQKERQHSSEGEFSKGTLGKNSIVTLPSYGPKPN